MQFANAVSTRAINRLAFHHEWKANLLAIIVSRSEALVVVSMLNAAGIIVDVGALQHASVSINPLALGHYRLMVPGWQ